MPTTPVAAGSPSPPEQTGAAARPPIYLDHHATTPIDPRVLEAMWPYFESEFGNPASSAHAWGWRAAAAVEDARERIAAGLGAEPREIVFTSGATESDNLALLGAAEASDRAHRHVVTVATEHPAVLDPCRYLGRSGWQLSELPVDSDGLVAMDAFEAVIGPSTRLVSVMAANNEIGVLQPIEEIGHLCRERGVLFHSDAAQAAGRIPLDVDAIPVDLLSISGHKLYGPKGIGALFVRSRRPRARIAPRQLGGGHERGLRSGTLPVPLIVGLARALELCLEEREQEARRLGRLRDRLFEQLCSALSGMRMNGHPQRRLSGNLNVGFEGVDGERLLLALADIAVSSGSACASAEPGPSHVLLALGLSRSLAGASLRFGLGRGTSEADVDHAARRVVETVRELRGGRD